MKTSEDTNGTHTDYYYTENYKLRRLEMSNSTNGKTKTVEYGYDEAGVLQWADDDGVITTYNGYDADNPASYKPDAYERVMEEATELFNKSFKVTYDYDLMDRITGITYPNNKAVNYSYNKVGEITGMPGYLAEAPVYENCLLMQTRAVNGVETAYTYDPNGRLSSLSYTHDGTEIKGYAFTYDGMNNIIQKNEDRYVYDQENRLTAAYLKGNFAVPVEDEEQPVGVVHEDLFGMKQLEFTLEEVLDDVNVIELDYAAGSIGVDLGGVYSVTRIELTPENSVNRVAPDAIRVFVSLTNYPNEYTEVKDFTAAYAEKEGKTVLEIVLNSPVEAKLIKIKTNFDDRDMDFAPRNLAGFKNDVDKIIKVYYTIDSRTEVYTYDLSGNRIKETVTLKDTQVKDYRYYPGSSRLMTDGRWVYVYDNNGNVVGKGDTVLIDGVAVKVKDVEEGYWLGIVSSTGEVELTSGNGGVKWLYDYDLMNRLVNVKKNSGTVANYTYNHKGYRVMKEKWDAEAGGFETTYYVFSPNGKLLYEEKVDAVPAATDDYRQYVYLFNKYFAREDGKVDLGGVVEETGKYFYHTDHLGSVVAVTDTDGQTVWMNEHKPFGGLMDEENTFDGAAVFASHEFDADVQLYYARARWYDAETGRFMSVDPIKDGLNWYAYCSNNPLVFVDPSGLLGEVFPYEQDKGCWEYQWGYNPNMDVNLPHPEESSENSYFKDFLNKYNKLSAEKRQANYAQWLNNKGELDVGKMVLGILKGIGKGLESDISFLNMVTNPTALLYNSINTGLALADLVSNAIENPAIIDNLVTEVVAELGVKAEGIFDLATQNTKGFMESFTPEEAGELFYRVGTMIAGGLAAESLAAKNAAGGAANVVDDAAGGIKPYNGLIKELKGTGQQAHHLIEKRFAQTLGVDAAKMKSIALTKAEHQAITNAWRQAIPYGSGTANAAVEKIMNAAQTIYKDLPAILKALGF